MDRDIPNRAPRELPEDVLLEQVIKALCDKPEAVRIEKALTTGTAAFDVFLDPSDIGKVIGKGGSYAYSIRNLFTAIYGRLGKNFHFNVPQSREPPGPRKV